MEKNIDKARIGYNPPPEGEPFRPKHITPLPPKIYNKKGDLIRR